MVLNVSWVVLSKLVYLLVACWLPIILTSTHSGNACTMSSLVVYAFKLVKISVRCVPFKSSPSAEARTHTQVHCDFTSEVLRYHNVHELIDNSFRGGEWALSHSPIAIMTSLTHHDVIDVPSISLICCLASSIICIMRSFSNISSRRCCNVMFVIWGALKYDNVPKVDSFTSRS